MSVLDDPREHFAREQDLVAAFAAALTPRHREPDWTLYHETAGFDVLAVHRDGYQVGIEAKLSLNLDVVLQALPGRGYLDYSAGTAIGPDYRAVLVPRRKALKPSALGGLLPRLGLGVLSVYNCRPGAAEPEWHLSGDMPDEKSDYRAWWPWNPDERCKLPDYIPDVVGGDKAPVALTPWKVKAIKLVVILERRGYVSRADMKNLGISPSRWTDPWGGFLSPDGSGRYVRCERTPDFKAQHPRNYAEIEADYETWFQPTPADWTEAP